MRRFQSRAPFGRETRFSKRVLLSYAAAGLPETFAIRAAAGDGLAEILLYDEIGFWGVSDMDFVRALAMAGEGPLNLRINSPGGDVFHGMAIANAVKSHPWPISVTIDGVAASAASWVAIAGKSLAMPGMSMLMIHNSTGIGFGDRKEMAEIADALSKIDDLQAAAYAAKSGKPAAEMAALMDATTYLTPAGALDMGLCDTIDAPAVQPPNAQARMLETYRARTVLLRAAYDPDRDGDDDALEAAGYIQMAISNCAAALGALIGTEDDDATDGPIVPGAHLLRHSKTAAATAAEWDVGAARDLPIDESGSWDGAAAKASIFEHAGGDDFDPAKARKGFLVYDAAKPKERGSYKLPFAHAVDGELKAVASGIRAAASRLPQTDIPQAAKDSARAVIDHYEIRIKPATESEDKAALGLRMRRLRLAEAA